MIVSELTEIAVPPSLGRLKHSLRERCPDCKKVLQVRVRETTELLRGETITKEIEYIVCSAECGYERDIKDPKKRKQTFDKTRYVKPVEEVRGGNRHANYSKSNQSTKDNGNGSRESFRSNSRRSSKNI